MKIFQFSTRKVREVWFLVARRPWYTSCNKNIDVASIDFFELKNLSHLRILTRDRFSSRNLTRNWMVRILSNLKISCIFHHVTNPPSMTFWAISRSVTVMLLTTLCWWFYDGDRFKMLVTESLCWRLFSLCWWFFQCIINRSPTP